MARFLNLENKKNFYNNRNINDEHFCQFYILDQSAKASDVTELHDKIDMIHTSSATTFNDVVTDILNRFGTFADIIIAKCIHTVISLVN